MKVITIGRDPSCSIVINDPQISRRHAIVRVSNLGRIEIVDLSSNGTSVNGNPLRKNVPCPVTRKNQVTFAGVSKLNWDDIPNPLRLYKWIVFGILGIITLAIISLVYNRMSDNGSVEIPAPTVVQEQGGSCTASPEGKNSQTSTNKKVTPSKNHDDAVNNDDYRHLLKPIDKPSHHVNPPANAEDNKTNKTDTKAKDKSKQAEKTVQTPGKVKTKAADNSAKNSSSNEPSGEQKRKKDGKL